MSQALFVLDSPVNAFIASILAKGFDSIELVFAIDDSVKDESEYISMFLLLFENVVINKKTTINYNSSEFWSSRREIVIHQVSCEVSSIASSSQSEVFFGNFLTNPVAVSLKRIKPVSYLFHSPADFIDLLFPPQLTFKARLKNFVRKIIKKEKSALLSAADKPIYSLIAFKNDPQSLFRFVDFRDFESTQVESLLGPLVNVVEQQSNTIMLLITGKDTVGAGDNNDLDISNYMEPNLQSVMKLMLSYNLTNANLWIKEHKSYLPINATERELLKEKAKGIGCKVFFVSDYLPPERRILPGECIIRYCNFDYIVGEPSSMLLNITNGSAKSIAAGKVFAPFRGAGEIGRNNEFLRINSLLLNPCEYF